MLEDISREEIKNQFKTNKKLRLTTMIVGAVAVVALGYFAYLQFVWNPANEESKDKYWPGLNLAVADSTDAAIIELRKITKEYDGKIGGEIAQFVLARQYMAKRQFEKAITELEGVEIEDTYVSVYAIGLQGDCYSEMKKYEKAANIYMEAANLKDNGFNISNLFEKSWSLR